MISPGGRGLWAALSVCLTGCGSVVTSSMAPPTDAGTRADVPAVGDTMAPDVVTVTDAGTTDVSAVTDVPPTGPTAHLVDCSTTCTPALAGAVCAPAGCTLGTLCVCEATGWACPVCPAPDCPAVAPSSGPSDCSMYTTQTCYYPPPPAISGEACRCINARAWDCQTFNAACPIVPPTTGGACQGEGMGCAYQGVGWRMDCECLVQGFHGWMCLMSAMPTVPTAGATCAGIPRGFLDPTALNGNAWAACRCEGTTDPRWACDPRECPVATPNSNDVCVGYEGMTCRYPTVNECVCESVSDLWQCG